MLFIVTDTSGKHGFIALSRADSARNEIAVIEEVPLAGGTFSAQLVPQIAALLTKHGLSKTDIGAFIVVSGPGSFTGLRVGLAAFKALAEILHKPIVPVSLLEVVALASGRQGTVLAALDAGRGEIYAGEYEIQHDLPRDGHSGKILERLVTRDELADIAQNLPVVTPDESVALAIRERGLQMLQVERPGAQAIGQLGWRKLQSGEIVTPEELDANYIRRSDAEIFAKPASSS